MIDHSYANYCPTYYKYSESGLVKTAIKLSISVLSRCGISNLNS